MDADIIMDESGNLQNLKGAIMETIDKILPISESLQCRDEVMKLGDIVENNQAPYERQIMQYQLENSFQDILTSAIEELEIGVAAEC